MNGSATRDDDLSAQTRLKREPNTKYRQSAWSAPGGVEAVVSNSPEDARVFIGPFELRVTHNCHLGASSRQRLFAYSWRTCWLR